MTNKFIALLLLCVVVLLGILLTRGPRPIVVPDELPRHTTKDVAALEAENVELRAKLAAVPSGSRVSLSPTITESAGSEHLKLLRDWVANKRVHLGISFVDANGQLTKEFIDVFGINEHEKAILEMATTNAHQQLNTLARARATVSRTTDGDYQIRVAPFIDEGRAIYDQLNRALQQALGPNKAGLFTELMGDRLEYSFNMFGAQERTLIMKRSKPAAGQRAIFSLEDKRQHGMGSSNSTSTAMSLAELKKYPGHGGILDLLPADAGE